VTDDPHALAALAALMRRALRDPGRNEWTAVMFQAGDPKNPKWYCLSTGTSYGGSSNTTTVPKGLHNEILVHTHPRGKTERADDTKDRQDAESLHMASYVLSADGVHKYDPNAKGKKETTEIDNRKYLQKNGQNWYDYVDQDSCTCANLK
jgi:hypothetical protein